MTNEYNVSLANAIAYTVTLTADDPRFNQDSCPCGGCSGQLALNDRLRLLLCTECKCAYAAKVKT